ncbi:hypothetical protein F4814DRAFT_440212 [Daldinia grandis]|nr:hypothetical protein F4814DRAFT_440212 [Daldinia grandis]
MVPHASLCYPQMPAADGIKIVLGNLVILLRDLLPAPPLPTLAIRSSSMLGNALEGQLRERFLTHIREAAQNLHRYQEHKFLTAKVRCKHTQHRHTSRIKRNRGRSRWTKRIGGMTEAYVHIRQISKMVINPKTPQLVWNTLPSDDVFASGSHLRCQCEEETLEAFLRLEFINCPHEIGKFWNRVVYQQRLKQAMDDPSWFQSMGADSGDEASYMVRSSRNPTEWWHRSRYSCLCSQPEVLYSEYFPPIDASTPYTRTQTTAAGVSGVNAGRDFDPSHPQHNKGPIGNESMHLPSLRTTNAYPRDFGANYDGRQFSVQTCDMTGRHQTANYLDYPDGLPNTDWPSNLPVFGEPLEGTQVSPSSFSSEAPSSATSEAMAAMTLDPMAVHSNTAGHLQANSSIVGPENHANAWTSSSYPSTISPKMLRINPSPTPASSSESVHNSMLAGGDLDLSTSTYEHQHPRSPFHSQRQSQKPRKELPNKPGRSRLGPTAPSEQPPPPSSKGKRPALARLSASPEQSPPKARPAQPKQELQDAAGQGSEGSPARGRGTRVVERVRSAKDDFLVRSKLAGKTYREIRLEGNFTEAESTLRGRFRTLTKDKEARVRKPEWQDNDIRLLKKAVRKLGKGNDMMPAKAPWGQVAEYIMDHGGSYQFGGATCHRKWKELVDEGKAGWK